MDFWKLLLLAKTLEKTKPKKTLGEKLREQELEEQNRLQREKEKEQNRLQREKEKEQNRKETRDYVVATRLLEFMKKHPHLSDEEKVEKWKTLEKELEEEDHRFALIAVTIVRVLFVAGIIYLFFSFC